LFITIIILYKTENFDLCIIIKIMIMVTADYYYPDWVSLIDFFAIRVWKIAIMGGRGLNPQSSIFVLSQVPITSQPRQPMYISMYFPSSCKNRWTKLHQRAFKPPWPLGPNYSLSEQNPNSKFYMKFWLYKGFQWSFCF